MTETFFAKHEPGTVFEFENIWYVADRQWYVSAHDAFEADDVNDLQLKVGWRTAAHPARSEQDMALVAAHQAEEARKSAEWHAKNDPINARLTEAAINKSAAKLTEQRARMCKEFALETRVQSRYVSKRGKIVAHHETEPKISVQWDGEDHPACMDGTSILSWFSLNDLKVL